MSSEAERELAQSEAAREALAGRLREASRALLEADQSLAKIPLLEHRLEELREENARLEEGRKVLEAEVARLAQGGQAEPSADA